MPTSYSGPDLAEMRRSAGVRREDVARRLGVSTSRIRNAELAASVPASLQARILEAILEAIAARHR